MSHGHHVTTCLRVKVVVIFFISVGNFVCIYVCRSGFVSYCVCMYVGPYLLVITEKSKVGEIDGHVIWEVKGTDILPFAKTTIHLNEMQVRILNGPCTNCPGSHTVDVQIVLVHIQ